MNDGFKKDYWTWHRLKKKLHTSDKSKTFFHEREIWFCSLGLNIGHEQDGKHNKYERPVLILKKFNHYTFWAIPLTSNCKNNKYNYRFIHKNKSLFLILSQIRLLDSKRLIRKYIKISKKEFSDIKERIINILR